MATIVRSRAVLASIDAALIDSIRASPPTIASPSILPSRKRRSGKRLPSTCTARGMTARPIMARRMASIVAESMFRASISARSDQATDQHSASLLITASSASRRVAESFLESRRPAIGRSGCRITAAAMTGPANGPRPASSTPATRSGKKSACSCCIIGVRARLSL